MSTEKEIGVKEEGQTPASPSSPSRMGGNVGGRVKIENLLVYKRDTWGSYGQHSNIYVFVLIDGTFLPAFIPNKLPSSILLSFKREINDSRKNIHRKYYASLYLPIGTLIKTVYDYASSSKREINIEYHIVTEYGLEKIEHSHEYLSLIHI